jgi:hypothetical protein
MMRKVRSAAEGISERVYAFIAKEVGDVKVQRNILLMSVILIILKKLPPIPVVKGAIEFCLNQFVSLKRELMQIEVDKESQMRFITDRSERKMIKLRERIRGAQAWRELWPRGAWQAGSLITSMIDTAGISKLFSKLG